MKVLLHIIWSICICQWYTHVSDCYTSLTDCRHLNNDTIRALHLAVFRCAGIAYSLVESKWCDYVMVEADSHLKLFPTSILDIYKVIEHIDMLSMGIKYQSYIVIPTHLAQILRFWVTCWFKMMWLCHGWGWQPTQTASHIHIRYKQSVWAHWYAVHWHMVAALHSFT